MIRGVPLSLFQGVLIRGVPLSLFQGALIRGVPLSLFQGVMIRGVPLSLFQGAMIKVIYFTSSLLILYIDRDECGDGSAQCGQTCTDVRDGYSSSYYCSCRDGYVLNYDSHNCTGE